MDVGNSQVPPAPLPPERNPMWSSSKKLPKIPRKPEPGKNNKIDRATERVLSERVLSDSLPSKPPREIHASRRTKLPVLPQRKEQKKQIPAPSSSSSPIKLPPLKGRVQSTVTNTSLLERIQTASDKIWLNKIGEASRGKLKPLTEQTISTVTKLEPVFYIQKSQIIESQLVLKINKLDIQNAFQAAILLTKKEILKDLPPNQDVVIKEILILASSLYTPVKEKFDQSGNPQLELEELKGKILTKLTERQDLYQKNFLIRILENLNNLDNSMNLDNVPELYKKDDVLSLIRISGGKAGDSVKASDKVKSRLPFFKDPKKRIEKSKGLLKIINELKENPNPYIKADTLEELGLKIEWKKWLTVYVLSADVMAGNNDRAKIMEHLKTVANLDPKFYPSYGFKTGKENIREIFAGMVLPTFRLNSYILPKYEKQLKGAMLGEIVDPKGLASRWVLGGEFPEKVWLDWLTIQQKWMQAKAEGKKDPDLEDQYKQKKREIFEVGGTKSIAYQIITDTVFQSGDSHIHQMKQGEDGEFYNFDFARFMPICPTYTKEGQTFTTLRSDFLDHPLALEPLTKSSPYRTELQAIKDLVLSWDFAAIVSQWQKDDLIGTPEFFKDSAEKLEEMERDFSYIKERPDLLEKLCSKHGIPLQDDKESMKRSLISVLIDKSAALRQECWKKAHPEAVEGMKRRIQQIKDYYASSETPTLRGAWDSYFSELAPFRRAIEILEKGPGSRMMLDQMVVGDRQVMKLRSLESLIQNSRESGLDLNLINEMETALMQIKAKSPDFYKARLATPGL